MEFWREIEDEVVLKSLLPSDLFCISLFNIIPDLQITNSFLYPYNKIDENPLIKKYYIKYYMRITNLRRIKNNIHISNIILNIFFYPKINIS